MKLDRITVDLARMNGQPCIRDLRITVRRVVELMAVYTDRDELRREFPELEDEDIRQALVLAPHGFTAADAGYRIATLDKLLDEDCLRV